MHELLDLARVLLATLVATGLLARLFIPRAAPAGTGLLLVGQIGLLLTVLPHQLQRPALAVPIVIVGLAGFLGAARVLDTRREWLVVAGAASLPVRIPFTLDGEHYNLLLPLYGVLAVAGMRLLLDDVRHSRARTRDTPIAGRGLLLDAAVAALVLLAALSASWSIDIAASSEKLALVYAPFAVLFVTAREWLPGRTPALPAAALVAVMCAAATVGIWQHWTETIWQNPKVIVANTYAPDFRTNSIFWDPNIYGRYVVVALLGVATWVAFPPRSRRELGVGAAASLLLGTGLWYTYSQSSLAALAVGSLMLAALALPRRGRVALAVCALALLALLPAAADELRGRDSRSRTDVAARGLALAAERPVHGLGLGAFEHGVRTLARDRGEQRPRQQASHTTPVTVLAELGVLGAAAYLLVLTAGLALAISGASRAREVAFGLRPGRPPALQWWAGATLAALVAHSMFYAGFFEDPLVWLCLGILATTSRAADGAS